MVKGGSERGQGWFRTSLRGYEIGGIIYMKVSFAIYPLQTPPNEGLSVQEKVFPLWGEDLGEGIYFLHKIRHLNIYMLRCLQSITKITNGGIIINSL